MVSTHTSSLYECEVVHQRLHPKRHAFRYGLFFLDLDLEEVPGLARKLWLFSHNGFNVYQFRDQDHLDLGKPTLRANLDAYLAEQNVALPNDTQVRLVTLPRILGYIFNPVCFYFFFDTAGKPLHVLVEVCNTFKELKPYFIAKPDDDGLFRLTTPKHFYVSPFTELQTAFDFRVRVPGPEGIEIHIDDLENDRTLLVSWIRGEQRTLTNRRLLWMTLKYPLLTLQVIIKIHWQAFRLWRKKLPFHRKSAQPEFQTDLLRPHKSLKDSSS